MGVCSKNEAKPNASSSKPRAADENGTQATATRLAKTQKEAAAQRYRGLPLCFIVPLDLLIRSCVLPCKAVHVSNCCLYLLINGCSSGFAQAQRFFCAFQSGALFQKHGMLFSRHETGTWRIDGVQMSFLFQIG